MAIEAQAQPPSAEDIVDAEIVEPGRMDWVKEKAAPHTTRAKAVLAGQRARVGLRVAAWFRTDDVTDEKLAQEIEKKRRQADSQNLREVKARASQLRSQLRTPDLDVESASLLSLELAGVEARLEGDADRMKVSGRDMSRARWSKKAGRVGMVAAGTYAGFQGLAMEPLLALAALGLGGPASWLYLGRPLSADEVPAATVPQQGVVPGAVPAGVPVPGAPFVPDTLASMSRVSLVKPESGRVQGEADLVTAMVKAGIITAAQRDETHLAGVIEPAGPGWTATVDLPRGLKASAAVSRIEDLASALRIKKSRIEITPDTGEDGHEGRFILWVANEDNPYGTGKNPSELINAPAWDFWGDGVPLGADARRKRHVLHLLWSSLMIGGLMGYGKSYLARLVAAAAALDPTVRIVVITGKTGPDWAPLRHVAHQWIAGASPDIIRRVLDVMEQTIEEMQDRGTELDRLYEEDPDLVPEGKITRELAGKGMGPVLLVVDELQELLDGAALVQVPIEDEPENGGRAKTRSGRDLMVEGFARYVRVTRFVGGMGVFITQRPDANSVPTALREVCAKRASYRVKGDRSAKMVLGDDAVAGGAAPHLLGDASKGVVVLDQGEEAGHATLKADVIDLPEFREICLRGRQLRTDAGTLTGNAMEYGREDAEEAARVRLLTDCVVLMDDLKYDRMRTERLLEILQSHIPGRYDDVTKVQLQARLRAAGAGTTQKLGPIDGMANPNGYTRAQLNDAIPRKKG
ncbi:hypothetical protein ACIBI8_40470 [Streptomyces sp. NPDC050529]|uniref:hypothetical protein n=1 Tax=Streptomyces sp. NPDC050529 TaxID=3365624 RepID=UPI0037AAF1BF